MDSSKCAKNATVTCEDKPVAMRVWENIQLLCLGLTIVGQILIGPMYIVGQSCWLVSNALAVIRNFILHRPFADKVKDAVMTAITTGLMLAYLIPRIVM